MDGIAPVFALIFIGIVAWMFESNDTPTTPLEKYDEATQELLEFLTKKAVAEGSKSE